MTAVEPADFLGLAALAKMAFDGEDLTELRSKLIDRMFDEPKNAGVLMDLSIIEQLTGTQVDGMALLHRALAKGRVYRRPAIGTAAPLRMLAVMAPGDFMANTPLEFMLDGSDIQLDLAYVLPGEPLPELPEHDLLFVAVGESEENQPILAALREPVTAWPRPVANLPQHIAELSRDGSYRLLHDAPGVVIPPTARIDRAGLARIALGEEGPGVALQGHDFPIIARPLGSHAGEGLLKLDDAGAARAYLQGRPEAEFFISPFVDYRSPDGLFRKYRIAVIEGRAFPSHGAFSSHWMIHYLNAGMRESAEKRQEEARWMAEFDEGFAKRHEGAIAALTERIGLDYFALDCGETPDGRLLIFEVDVAMIVHAMDPPDIFPYKAGEMERLFEAFRAMLRRKAGA